MLPVRHSLGALLLDAGRAEEAEQVYRVDLEKNRDNGWSLLGLQQSLEAQGRVAEARRLDTRIRAAWPRTDVDPKASCYCATRLTGASAR